MRSWIARSADRATSVAVSLLAILLLLPASARAIDPSLCADDGVEEVPPFALGRDENQCLLVDPGNGDPPLPIQYEIYHVDGIGGDCDQPEIAGNVRIDNKLSQWGRCKSKNNTPAEGCTLLMWDIVADNYADPACRGKDIFNNGPNSGAHYIWIKDAVVANSWKCKNANLDDPQPWIGPVPGVECEATASDGSHTDGIQWRGFPAWGGWFIMQDTIFANGYNAHLRIQESDEQPDLGSLMFQGVHTGRLQSVGKATTYIDDCIARGQNPEICADGRSAPGIPIPEWWLIDVTGNSQLTIKGHAEKVVVVNTGCDENGCNGTIGYQNGWPQPLSGNYGTGPGTCPNGELTQTSTDKCGVDVDHCYCYTSLEKALADGHKPPPFIHLSAAGWENPPSGAGSYTPPADSTNDPDPTAPEPPFLLASGSTPPEPAPAEAQAAVVGFALWNAETDTLIDSSFTSGETISVASNACTAIEILGNSYLDSSGGPGSVTYSFDGQDLGGCGGAPGTSFENEPPYAWEHDSGTNRFECATTLSEPGSHSLTVTPFDGDDCTGTQGTSVTLDFVVQ